MLLALFGKIRKISILNHLKHQKILLSSIKLDIDYNEDYQKFKKILFKSKIKPENFINKTLIRKLVYREKYKPINKL